MHLRKTRATTERRLKEKIMDSHYQIKEKFINNLPPELVGKLSEIHLKIVDAAIDKLHEGTLLFQNRIPENDEEIFVVLGYETTRQINLLKGLSASQQ